MKKNDLVGKAFWSLMSQIFSRGSLIVSAIVLTRHLNTSDFAAYSYFQLTISMLAVYAAMGLGVTSSRYFAEVGHEKHGSIPAPLGLLWLTSIVIAITVFAVILVAPSRLVTAGLPIPKWLIALGVLTLTLEIVPGGAVLGLERYKQSSLICMISGAMTLVGALYASIKSDPLWAMSVMVVAAFLQGVGESIIVVKAVGWKRLAVSRSMMVEGGLRLLKFAGPMLFISLIAISGSWIVGRMVLIMENSLYEFSIYTIGLQWFALVLVLPGIIAKVILPRVVRTSLKTEATGQAKLIWQGIKISTLTAFAVALLGALMAPMLIKMYGTQYNENSWFLSEYMLAAFLNAPANTLGNSIIANNGQMQWLKIMLIWFATLISTAIIMVRFDVNPGAVSLGIAAVVQTALGFYVARSKKII